ncbi:MAG: hypothetical protein LJE57_09630 [Gallionella sp.]|nr:hypothetical protein [Gallionella sp.]
MGAIPESGFYDILANYDIADSLRVSALKSDINFGPVLPGALFMSEAPIFNGLAISLMFGILVIHHADTGSTVLRNNALQKIPVKSDPFITSRSFNS